MTAARVVQLGPLPTDLADALAERFGAVTVPPPGADGRLAALAALGDEVTVGVTTARHGVDGPSLDAVPSLGAVVSFGVGVDAIDLDVVARRGIGVATTPGMLTDAVADTAVALVLDAVRGVSAADRFVRDGRWAAGATFGLTGQFTGRTVGIVGMGRIGTAVAERLEGFHCEIGYHNRRPVADCPYAYHASVAELADAVEVLVVTAPGGGEPLVDADVLDRLGPEGVLVNVGRGSVVDEAALVEALESGRLGAAGLDVFADEPRVPSRLLALDNVVLTPHIGSATVETRTQMTKLVLDNVAAFLETGRLVTPLDGA
ncbi:2-hydroxyacid dehydrogenase [Aeromicrobium sp. IC_218]|uniref:2-hydroxyacid dehydrogenase n=1 Tax=Aeromicrobium sp. IC_218 TaxID=2545468 RepID=UPI00103C1F22|nr:2-hydroxyacid dehydrogenase [Aeromicrobium sp. IC_218]TCJ00883.1 2-hydroxyacid dehydrogenase [Aeromicrobium sp. IC_218]